MIFLILLAFVIIFLALSGPDLRTGAEHDAGPLSNIIVVPVFSIASLQVPPGIFLKEVKQDG